MSNNHGGARPGAGAPKKIPTVTIGIRVPQHLAAVIKPAIQKTVMTIIKRAENPSTKY